MKFIAMYLAEKAKIGLSSRQIDPALI